MSEDYANLFLSNKDINKLFNDMNAELRKFLFGKRQINSL